VCAPAWLRAAMTGDLDAPSRLGKLCDENVTVLIVFRTWSEKGQPLAIGRDLRFSPRAKHRMGMRLEVIDCQLRWAALELEIHINYVATIRRPVVRNQTTAFQ